MHVLTTPWGEKVKFYFLRNLLMQAFNFLFILQQNLEEKCPQDIVTVPSQQGWEYALLIFVLFTLSLCALLLFVLSLFALLLCTHSLRSFALRSFTLCSFAPCYFTLLLFALLIFVLSLFALLLCALLLFALTLFALLLFAFSLYALSLKIAFLTCTQRVTVSDLLSLLFKKEQQ